MRRAGGRHFADAVRAGAEVGEAVVAVDVRGGKQFPGIEGAVAVGVQEDGHTGHTQLAGVANAVTVQVVELQAADRHQLEVAEQHTGNIGAAADRDVSRVGGGLRRAGGRHFADAVRAGAEVGEAVVAVDVRGGKQFPGIEGAVAVGVQEDGHTGHTQLAGVANAVTVQVVELHAADRHQLEIPEVDFPHRPVRRYGD